MRRYLKKNLKSMLDDLKSFQCNLSQITSAEYTDPKGMIQLGEYAGHLEQGLI